VSDLGVSLAPVIRAENALLAVHVTATVTITAVAPEGETVTPEVAHGTEIEVGPDFGTGETIGVSEAVRAQDGSLMRTTIGPAKRPLGATAVGTETAEMTDVIAAALAIEIDRGLLVLEPTVGKGLAPY
jgi:hypothetical protein